jgi:hypothetical protein
MQSQLRHTHIGEYYRDFNIPEDQVCPCGKTYQTQLHILTKFYYMKNIDSCSTMMNSTSSQLTYSAPKRNRPLHSIPHQNKCICTQRTGLAHPIHSMSCQIILCYAFAHLPSPTPHTHLTGTNPHRHSPLLKPMTHRFCHDSPTPNTRTTKTNLQRHAS